ncbi:MAG: hypothetical protein U0360_04845 [Dehalococcoidia bacterium]
MPGSLLSIYQPDGDPPPPEVLAPIMRNVGALIEEIEASGAWVFNGGLDAAAGATMLRADGTELVETDGRVSRGRLFQGAPALESASAR